MKIAAIVPVKTFSKAKTRLNLSDQDKTKLCKIMLEEVLKTISDSKLFDKIVVVSKDESALRISKKFEAIQIIDKDESGVNNAVSLADEYLYKEGFDGSIVFPQDIPFMSIDDIQCLLDLKKSSKFIGIVPSRRFDGTNALVRFPLKVIETHYDEDSYKIHLQVAKSVSSSSFLMLIQGIMLDIDVPEDYELLKTYNEKPELLEKIKELCKSTS